MNIDAKALETALEKTLSGAHYRCVLSNPSGKDVPYTKITISLVDGQWQAEQYTKTQVFHLNFSADALKSYIATNMTDHFRQLNAWDEEREHQLRISAKGKVLYSTASLAKAPPPKEGHNREKQYLLPEGEAVPVLVDMGVFTKEGKVVRAMYDKYRQINRFLEILDDEMSRFPKEKPLRIIDFGCGKSYLTFLVYHYLTAKKGLTVEMTGLDLKADVIEKCIESAKKYGYRGLSFAVGDIQGYDAKGDVDMVLTLHACDTATDHALFNALRWNAKVILSVPCCQHELNGQLISDTFAILGRYGIVKERVAALMTDAIRGNLLECCGYKAQLMEFIDFAHTPKNILIRAVKVPGRKRQEAYGQVRRLMEEFHLRPTLYSLLAEDGRLEGLEKE